MALMFRNTYQPSFYKQLYNYVHASYRKHRALNDAKNPWQLSSLINKKKIKNVMRIVYYEIRFVIEKRRLSKVEKFAS